MFNLNNKWHRVYESHLNIPALRGVVIIHSWDLVTDAVNEKQNFTKSMCAFEFETWDENSSLLLPSIAESLAANWVEYDKSKIDSLIKPAITLEQSKIIKSNEIRNACSNEILAGFSSNALGSAHLYPSNDKDQVNLSGTIQKSLLPSASIGDVYMFLCADINNVWAYRPHSATQIQQVGTDAYNAILNSRIKNATLQGQIDLATTKAEVEAILWS